MPKLVFPPVMVARAMGTDVSSRNQYYLWQDRWFSLHLEEFEAVQEGCLVRLHWNGDSVSKREVLSTPSALKPGGDALRWRKSTSRGTRMQALRRRHGVVKAIRGWFDEQDFLEVATPVRVRAPSPEVQFDPIAAGDGYLITSPEFQMKRMLVGGFEKIYQIGPCFRGSERGRLHNPEFTMLEWYRVDEPFSKLIEDVRAMLASIPEEWVSPEVHAVCAQEWPVRRVSELIEEHWRVQLEPEENSVRLREKLRAAGQGAFLQQERLEQERDFEVIFSRMWDRFESVLGRAAPLFVIDWPQRLASLAQFNHKGWAQRVEVYVGGMELANGFLELCDPAEQQRRFMADLERRRVAQKSELPLDSLFLEGLSEGLPPSVGMAMGIERLITWLSGEESIQSAMGFVEEEIFLVK